MGKKTKKEYEQYLNQAIQPDYESDEWIIEGKRRSSYTKDRYGSALRKHDPIAFQVGFNEWRLEYV